MAMMEQSSPARPVLRFDLAAAARGWMPPRVAEAFAAELGASLGASVREAGAPPAWAGRPVGRWAGPARLGLGSIAIIADKSKVDAVSAALDVVAARLASAPAGPGSSAMGPMQAARFVVGAHGEQVLLGASAGVVLAWWAAVAKRRAGPTMRRRVESLTLPTHVELGRRPMRLEALSALAVGDVVMLGPADQPVVMEVSGGPRYAVVPVQKNGRVGAKIVRQDTP